jgi:hypothetical protein
VCHDWWYKRQAEEAEASRRMWDEFDRTHPLRDPAVTEDDEPAVILEKTEPARLGAQE